jgi:hypothetical protein
MKTHDSIILITGHGDEIPKLNLRLNGLLKLRGIHLDVNSRYKEIDKYITTTTDTHSITIMVMKNLNL